MTVKQYLNQIRLLDIRIDQRIEQAEEIKQKAFLIEAVDTTKDRVQSSQSESNLKYVDKYVDMMAEIDKLVDEYVDLKNKIIGEIHQLEDQRYMEVLYLRYVNGLRFIEIAKAMGYGDRHVKRLHHAALREFGKKMSFNVT